MTDQYNGIVEGFYGRPWTHQERLEMFAFMQSRGLNGYIYAPKDDALHRDNWRAPYPDDALARFATLAQAARDHGIHFTFAVSPGLSLCYSDPVELNALLAKLQPIIDLGVPSIGIFFDDVPPELAHPADQARYKSLGEAQADLLTRLHQALPDQHLITVPTFYCGEPQIPYLHDLAAMPEAVEIMWTGPAVCSHTITQAHMAAVAQVLKRPALLWDNYPVNDARMVGELHIAPYSRREANLPVRGIYLNPMSLAHASKFGLGTFARYLTEQEAYAPEVAWQVEATALVGSGLVDALAVFAEAVTISPLAPEEPPAMRDLIAPFSANLLPYLENPALPHLRKGTERMRRAHDRLQQARADTAIIADMGLWLDEYDRWIAMLEAAAQILAPMLDESDQGPERRAAAQSAAMTLRQGLKEAVDFRTVTCGYTIRNFLQGLLIVHSHYFDAA